MAKRVDALHETQVEDFAAGLSSMADNSDLARAVPFGGRRQRRPAQAAPTLLVQPQVGFVVRMKEDVADRLEVIAAALEEPNVFRGNFLQVAAIGIERFFAIIL